MSQRDPRASGGPRRGPPPADAPVASLNPARIAAARALVAAEDGDHVEEALARALGPRDGDRALAWFLAFGVLRHRARLDAALRPHLSTPLGALDPPVRAALRVGAFEVLFARTAGHAAVHQAVELCRRLGAPRATGLVNAVLRRVRAPEGLSRAEAVDAPSWLYARWAQRYGVEAAEAWLGDAAEPPPLFLVQRAADPPPIDGLIPTGVAGVWRATESRGRVEELPGFAEGRWWVQDLASVRVADLVRAAPGVRVLDACAAPGGKAFRLASAGAEVLAVDRSAERLALARESAARLGLGITFATHDWETGPMPGGAVYDAVLVDAPCTALGTLRRHPEVKWRRQLVDVLTQPTRQRAILDAAAAHVAAGGALVYAVCSPEPEEGPAVARAFAAAHPEFTLAEELSTAPPTEGEDAFYAARLVRA